jgi:hypothetical protein
MIGSPSSTENTRSAIWRWVILFLFFGLALFRIRSASFDDFAVYWRAGKEALQGVSVYTEPGHYQFKYAPFTALSLGWIHDLLLRALSLMGWTQEGFRPHGSVGGMLVSEASRGVANVLYWFFLSAWMFWMVDLSRRISPARLRWKHLALVLILLLQSLSEELNLGQVNFIPVICMVLVLRELDRNTRSMAQVVACSIGLALAVQFKLFSFIVFPLLAFRGRWSWIFGSALAIAGCNLLGLGVPHGWSHAASEFVAWATSLTKSSDQLMYSEHNISWIGSVGKATGMPIAAKASWALLVLVFLVGQFRIRHLKSEAQISWNLASILILNPLTWNYWMLFLAPQLFQLLASYSDKIERNPRRFAGIFLLAWIPFHVIFSAWTRNWLEPPMIFGLTLLWFVRNTRGDRR